MSSSRKRMHPSGFNRLQNQTVRKKSKSSPCSNSSSSTSQCHSSSLRMPSPMQLRKRKGFDKDRARGMDSSLSCSPRVTVTDQQVPVDLGQGDLGNTGEELGLFEEDPDMTVLYVEQDRLVGIGSTFRILVVIFLFLFSFNNSLVVLFTQN